ncbi:PilC/PilY family type IV pilus protein [Pseudomonas neustonica]|uniref:pilus assembly protein n=1 Tax=Pseudomonas neustonica TaxID=2487346 RepID=UPI003F44A6F7
MKTLTHVIPSALLTGYLLLSPSILMADDTEIYFAKADSQNDDNKPAANVLFLIDTSGSMCDPRSGGGGRDCSNATTPMVALRSAFSTMIDGLSDEVRIGLAKFNGGLDSNAYGGYVFHSVSELDEQGKSEIKNTVNQLQGTSNTPTMEAYSEAARYMLGMAPTDYAKSGEAVQTVPDYAVNMNYVCTKFRGNGSCRDWEWRSDAIYESPIDMSNQCESNHIIVMTDGAPTRDADYSSVNNIVGGSCSSTSGFDGSNDEKKSFSCQRDLATFMQSESPNGKKPIKTWQIAFGVGENSNEVKNMRRVAAAGGTEDVRYADDADELAAAFTDILDLIDDESRSMTAPGVAVNTMNRFQHLDQLYYSVFKPVESSYWEGNLKRYRLNDGEIKGVGGNAIDSSTGFFREDAQSFWSEAADGADVTKGGARNEVGNRRLFYTDSENGGLKRLSWDNASSPSNEFLGLESDATEVERNELLSRLAMMWGDPLHSVPVMVNYGENENNNYVFVSNNGGMLHAVSTLDGSEAFAFMPYEFISKANEYTVDRPPLANDNSRQVYGLDGSWIPWRKPGETAEDAPEAVYLYGGMRRGGRSYYALDVTNPTTPKKLWRISSDSAGFERLGQTWSTPTLTSIPNGSGTGTTPVLVFGGGYSPADHDYKTTRSAGDAMGNAVYIVNAEDGSLIWSASSTAGGTKSKQVGSMRWAVPGGISVVDMDFDGVADHLYFADLGGQVFRIDIDGSGGSTYAVERLADLSTGTGAANRRFFEAPSVGYVKDGAKNVLYVSLGSGYRSHPLDEVTQDGFFVIKDEGALGASGNSGVANINTMTDVTNGGFPKTDERGWFYYFNRSGEKSMSSPIIYDGKILFTTYAPTADQEQENVCAVRYGESFLHTVELISGRPAALTGEAPPTRSQRLTQSTPPPTPVILVDENGDYTTLVGTEVVGDAEPGDQRLRKRRWMQLPKDEANVIRQQETPNDGE